MWKKEKSTDQSGIRAGRRELRSSCCAIRMILLRRERADYLAASSCAAPLEFPFLLFGPNIASFSAAGLDPEWALSIRYAL